MSASTVSLPMYNLPEMRQVNAAFWTALRIVLAHPRQMLHQQFERVLLAFHRRAVLALP